MRRRRTKVQDQAIPTGAPPWMVTYGDLVTQVLAFFVLLYSFSSLNEQKFQEMIASLQGAFRSPVTSSGPPPVVISTPPAEGERATITPTRPNSTLTALQRQLEASLEKEGAAEIVSFKLGDHALVIHLDAAALFDSGRAEIRQEAVKALDAIGSVLAEIPNHVRIEGHTDSDPMTPNIQFPDNWMLSGGRATSVLRYLNEFKDVKHERMSFAGYADTRPVASNETAGGKAKNRRVDIIVLTQ